MKKIFISFFVFVISISSSFSASRSCYYDGYWGTWVPFVECINGNWSGFVIHKSYDHPSDYFFKFQIDTSVAPEVVGEWFIYKGTVEYYVSENYPTIRDILKAKGFPFVKPYDSPPIAKRIAAATIKTYKRRWDAKKHPKCYNFVFDDVAIGLDGL